MIAKIQHMIVILPRMVAWIAVQITDIRAIWCHGEGLEEPIFRVLEESNKARAGWVPPFAEEVKTTCPWVSIGVGDNGHLLQGHDELGMSGIHVHLPDARLAWGVLVLVYVLNPDILGSTVLHALEIVSQRRGTIG